MTILETIGLTRRYGRITALDSLNLTVQQGEVFGLLGPNGAGKTTAIKMLTTLLPPSEGTAVVAGADIRKHPARVRGSIGYVPQLISVDGSLSGRENMEMFARLYGVPRALRRGRVAEALAFAALDEAAERVVRGYSGGMVRRLELAMAILHRPKILFLDEPTVGLDPVARQTVWRQMRELSGNHGMTIFVTTHFMEEADSLCGRVAILNHGKLAALGSPEDLKTTIGRKDASLDDVFSHFTGHSLDTENEGNYRGISQTRRTLARLG